jgi:periplasmic protein TonB
MPALAQFFFAAALEPSQRNIRLALGASLLIHAVVLSIHFKLPEALNKATEQALDVILVNSKGPRKPQHIQAKAQANLDGGGNTDEDRRAKTPLPAAVQMQEGDDLKQAQQRVRQLELQTQQMLTSLRGDKKVATAATRNEPAPPTPTTNAGADLTSAAIAIARLEAQIARNVEEYNRRPRKKFIGARVEEYKFAQYVEDWRQRVERLGNLNYPDAAKGRLYGDLVLTAIIRADGSLARVDIDRSSGKKILDAAARRIVELGAPYPPFSPALLSEATELQITRTWSFTKSNQLQTTPETD